MSASLKVFSTDDLVSELTDRSRYVMSRREYDRYAHETRTVGIIAAIMGMPPDIDGDRLADKVKELVGALEQSLAELATLRARLAEPYASNVAAALARGTAALKRN